MKFKHLFGLLLTAFTTICVAGCGSGDETEEAGQSSADVSAYYKDIDDNSSTLLADLKSLNKKKRKKTVGWDGLRTAFKTTDADPDGSGKILGFYDNDLIGPKWDSGKTWNREHVWPDSLGGNKLEGDIHMTRPAGKDTNGDRGNKFYAANGGYDPGSLGHPNYRGICARIIFYCVIATGGLSLVDSNKGGGSQMGKLSDLLKWNLQYEPSGKKSAAPELRCEYNRNNIIEEKYQGNRNPFIDHPEYACKIWGKTNSATKKACGIN